MTSKDFKEIKVNIDPTKMIPGARPNKLGKIALPGLVFDPTKMRPGAALARRDEAQKGEIPLESSLETSDQDAVDYLLSRPIIKTRRRRTTKIGRMDKSLPAEVHKKSLPSIGATTRSIPIEAEEESKEQCFSRPASRSFLPSRQSMSHEPRNYGLSAPLIGTESSSQRPHLNSMDVINERLQSPQFPKGRPMPGASIVPPLRLSVSTARVSEATICSDEGPRLLHRITTDQDITCSFAFCDIVAIGTITGMVYVYDISGRELLCEKSHEGYAISCIDMKSSNNELFLAVSDSYGKVSVLNFSYFLETQNIKHHLIYSPIFANPQTSGMISLSPDFNNSSRVAAGGQGVQVLQNRSILGFYAGVGVYPLGDWVQNSEVQCLSYGDQYLAFLHELELVIYDFKKETFVAALPLDDNSRCDHFSIHWINSSSLFVSSGKRLRLIQIETSEFVSTSNIIKVPQEFTFNSEIVSACVCIESKRILVLEKEERLTILHPEGGEYAKEVVNAFDVLDTSATSVFLAKNLIVQMSSRTVTISSVNE